MKQRATIVDVATRAGTSRQSVSNVLNDRLGEVSEATRQRVQQAIVELGYHRNPMAHRLRSGKLDTIGFLVLDESRHFLADAMTDQIISGFADVLRQSGHAMLVQPNGPERDIDQLLAPLQSRRVDGAAVLLSGPVKLRKEVAARLAQVQEPVVLVQEHSDLGSGLPTVSADDFGAGRALAEHLLAVGHRRIGFVTAKDRWSAIEQRHAGFREVLKAAGCYDSRLVSWRGGFDAQSPVVAVAAMLDRPDPPTAFIGGNDLIALGIVRELVRLSLSVPDQAAVAGFDDFDFSAVVNPALTTVQVRGYEVGAQAAHRLVTTEMPRRVVLPTQLCVRDST